MRPELHRSLLVVLLSALLALAGCATAPNARRPHPGNVAKETPPPPPPSPSETLRIPQPLQPPSPPAPPSTPAWMKVVSVYLDNSTNLRPALVEQLSRALADGLRQLGYEVRSATVGRPAAPLPGPVTPLLICARAAPSTATAPATLREATYLHPNSPRLVLVGALDPGTKPGGEKPTTVLVALLCETVSGKVLWRGRATLDQSTPDTVHLQRLAGEALRGAPRTESLAQ